MSLFLNLVLGHLLGDFVLQPGRLVVAKRNGVPGLLLHVGLVGGISAAVLGADLRDYWSVVVLAAGLHLIVERITISARFHTRSRGLFVFVLDQAMHILSLGLLAWLALQGSDAPVRTFGTQFTDAGLAAIDAAVGVVFLGSILAFETGNTLVPPESGNTAILGFDWARLGGMVERGGALYAALALHPAAALVPFVPRAVYALTLPPQRRARQMLEASAGLVVCALAYAFIVAVTIVTT